MFWWSSGHVEGGEGVGGGGGKRGEGGGERGERVRGRRGEGKRVGELEGEERRKE